MQNENRPLSVDVFIDYICPFCYIGSARLLRLSAGLGGRFTLCVNWHFIEIHPETPAEGMPLEALGYAPDQWARMMENLYAMAARDGIEIAERQFTTNSRAALRLAEAASDCGDEIFARLHAALFAAFFTRRENIGDGELLRRLGREAGVDEARIEAALAGDATLESRLARHAQMAAVLGVRGVPAFVIGDRLISGCVDAALLERVAEESLRDARG